MTVVTGVQQFQRAIMGLPFTAEYTFGLNDEALPGTSATVSVSVVDAEGTTIASGDATVGDVESGQQVVSFSLDADVLTQVDLLTVTWSASDEDYEVASLIDVCDARLFPLSDYSQFSELDSYSDAQLEGARVAAEAYLERECGRPFARRYGTETRVLVRERGRRDGLYGERTRGYGRLQLRHPHVQELRSITRSYWDSSTDELATYSVNLDYATLDSFDSVVYYDGARSSSEWDGLFGNLTFAFEHGKWLADVRRICLILARYRLLQGPLERRAVSMTLEGGGSVQLLTPGMAAARTGIPEVDRFIRDYNERVLGFISGL